MTEDPRLILSARRSSGQDDGDPAIAGALTAAESNPALKRWIENEQLIDAAIVQKFRQVQPPPGLRETILAGGKVSRRSWQTWFEQRAWRNFRNSELLAIAAVVLIFAVALASRLFVPAPTNWQIAGAIEVAKIENEQRLIEHFSGDIKDVRTWLAAQTCPLPETLPAQLRSLTILGCSKHSWRGQPMSIICFDLGGGTEVHLVTISRASLPAEPPVGLPEFAEINGYQTASWSEGDVSMMLIGKVPRANIEKLFKTVAAVASCAPGFNFLRI